MTTRRVAEVSIDQLQSEYDRARGATNESAQLERIGAAWDANERARSRLAPSMVAARLGRLEARAWRDDLLGPVGVAAALVGWFVVLALLAG